MTTRISKNQIIRTSSYQKIMKLRYIYPVLFLFTIALFTSCEDVIDIDTLGPFTQFTWIVASEGEAWVRIENQFGLVRWYDFVFHPLEQNHRARQAIGEVNR